MAVYSVYYLPATSPLAGLVVFFWQEEKGETMDEDHRTKAEIKLAEMAGIQDEDMDEENQDEIIADLLKRAIVAMDEAAREVEKVSNGWIGVANKLDLACLETENARRVFLLRFPSKG